MSRTVTRWHMRVRPWPSAAHEADLPGAVLQLAKEQLVRPRCVLALVEHHEPPPPESRAIQVARDLSQRLGLGLGVAADLDLDRVPLSAPEDHQVQRAA